MKKIWVQDIGEISLNRSKKAKNIRISIKPTAGIKLTYPYFSSPEVALAFLGQKKDWIKTHLQKVKKLENSQTLFTENTPFKTRYHDLILRSWESTQYKIERKNQQLLICYPQQLGVTNPQVQLRIRKEIEYTWKIEGEFALPKLTDQIAKHYKFDYKSITIKNVKSKWGSCSYYNDIILSLHLMRLPQHLIEYVILHELCHTKEKNHQAPFWKLMDSVTHNKAKLLDKELKKYSTKLY